MTPVDAKIKSLIFTVSSMPSFDLDSLKVKVLAKFLATESMPSYPCLPVKVFAFLVLTNKALIIFYWIFHSKK